MHFLQHIPLPPAIAAGLQKHGHTLHPPLHLLTDLTPPSSPDTPPPDPPSLAALPPRELFDLLVKKQWNLLTGDPEFLRRMYEEKIPFPYLIVHILPTAADDPSAIDRLFARYPRLTPRRLYTITASRIKIRQLPGPPG